MGQRKLFSALFTFLKIQEEKLDKEVNVENEKEKIIKNIKQLKEEPIEIIYNGIYNAIHILKKTWYWSK